MASRSGLPRWAKCPSPKRVEFCKPPSSVRVAQGMTGVICDARDESPTGPGTPQLTIQQYGHTKNLSSEMNPCSSHLRLSSLHLTPRNPESGQGNTSPGPPSSIYSPDPRSPFSPMPKIRGLGLSGVQGMPSHPLASSTTVQYSRFTEELHGERPRRPSAEEYNEVLGPFPSTPVQKSAGGLRDLHPSLPGPIAKPDSTYEEFPDFSRGKGLISPLTQPHITPQRRWSHGSSAPFPPASKDHDDHKQTFEIQAEVQGPDGQSFVAGEESASNDKKSRHRHVSTLPPVNHHFPL